MSEQLDTVRRLVHAAREERDRLRTQNAALLAALGEVMQVAFDGPAQPVSAAEVVAWRRGIEQRARAASAAAEKEETA